MKIELTTIKFPDFNLKTREAHKLRGYFGNLFKDKSPLLHNHFETGESRYAYPLIQYKIIKNIPYLVGLKEGAQLLNELFLKIKEICLDDKTYPVFSKNISNYIEEVSIVDEKIDYEFLTLWMALNQKNFDRYLSLSYETKKDALLNKILIGNILSLYKYLDYHVETKLHTSIKLIPKETNFKGNKMIAFSGKFSVNAVIPDLLGLGKSVSRGFGTIKKLK